MAQFRLINIHSHSSAAADEWVIKNIRGNFGLPPAQPYSAGLHPWYLKESTWRNELDHLENLASDVNMLAIGECGLDRVTITNFELQQTAFADQVLLANEYQKPLIIHCVRAFPEVLSILAKHNNKVPVIFHGYQKNEALATTLLSEGHYLSFGKGLQRPSLTEVFRTVPLDKVFLETDDSSITIQEMYSLAANILSIPTETLAMKITNNLQRVFNITI